MTLKLLSVPVGLDFSALKLARDPVDGDLSFDWSPIEQLCAANGLDVAVFRDQHEDNVAGLITAWYAAHRAAGGDTDPVQEQILAEVAAEDALGVHRVQRGPATSQ